jgi:hypothetical protein
VNGVPEESNWVDCSGLPVAMIHLLVLSPSSTAITLPPLLPISTTHPLRIASHSRVLGSSTPNLTHTSYPERYSLDRSGKAGWRDWSSLKRRDGNTYNLGALCMRGYNIYEVCFEDCMPLRLSRSGRLRVDRAGDEKYVCLGSDISSTLKGSQNKVAMSVSHLTSLYQLILFSIHHRRLPDRMSTSISQQKVVESISAEK